MLIVLDSLWNVNLPPLDLLRSLFFPLPQVDGCHLQGMVEKHPIEERGNLLQHSCLPLLEVAPVVGTAGTS